MLTFHLFFKMFCFVLFLYKWGVVRAREMMEKEVEDSAGEGLACSVHGSFM